MCITITLSSGWVSLQSFTIFKFVIIAQNRSELYWNSAKLVGRPHLTSATTINRLFGKQHPHLTRHNAHPRVLWSQFSETGLNPPTRVKHPALSWPTARKVHPALEIPPFREIHPARQKQSPREVPSRDSTLPARWPPRIHQIYSKLPVDLQAEIKFFLQWKCKKPRHRHEGVGWPFPEITDIIYQSTSKTFY